MFNLAAWAEVAEVAQPHKDTCHELAHLLLAYSGSRQPQQVSGGQPPGCSLPPPPLPNPPQQQQQQEAAPLAAIDMPLFWQLTGLQPLQLEITADSIRPLPGGPAPLPPLSMLPPEHSRHAAAAAAPAPHGWPAADLRWGVQPSLSRPQPQQQQPVQQQQPLPGVLQAPTQRPEQEQQTHGAAPALEQQQYRAPVQHQEQQHIGATAEQQQQWQQWQGAAAAQSLQPNAGQRQEAQQHFSSRLGAAPPPPAQQQLWQQGGGGAAASAPRQQQPAAHCVGAAPPPATAAGTARQPKQPGACPICGMDFPAGTSNAAVNAHVDHCLTDQWAGSDGADSGDGF